MPRKRDFRTHSGAIASFAPSSSSLIGSCIVIKRKDVVLRIFTHRQCVSTVFRWKETVHVADKFPTRHAINFVICKQRELRSNVVSRSNYLRVTVWSSKNSFAGRWELKGQGIFERRHSYRCTSIIRYANYLETTIACRVSIAYLRAWLASWYPLIKIVSGELITRSPNKKLGETKDRQIPQMFLNGLRLAKYAGYQSGVHARVYVCVINIISQITMQNFLAAVNK